MRLEIFSTLLVGTIDDASTSYQIDQYEFIEALFEDASERNSLNESKDNYLSLRNCWDIFDTALTSKKRMKQRVK